ncbi:DUF1294 domain-containing protein [Solirubrobacter soli]|uniref:DUF1294 domain-containing protein n=1 Tax=Solirubrobacter soli TaxID=363832 RepID=UPI0004190C69|nr:DUF1294 domain-containing protein [Solirubrobacter soli]
MPSKRTLTRRAIAGALVAGIALAAALVVATDVAAIIAYVVGMGVVTFLVYGYDKLQAKRGGRRVPETALLVISLIGGALGGWAGMLILRHKTRHTSFWLAQVVGTVVIGAALWLL